MKSLYIFLFFVFFAHSAQAINKNETVIREILSRQAAAWNKGDIEGYMKAGYWNNDSLIFIGKSGPTYGFKATLERYKKSYSDTAKMGKLTFSGLQIRQLSPEYYFVIGHWELERAMGNLSGAFTLVFRKIKGEWRIICDHSS